MRWIRGIGAAVTAILLSACSKSASDGGAGSGAASAKPPSAPSAAASSSEAVKKSALPVADVKALVQRWAAAQSGNDFAAYEVLYAPRFTGVKRAGTYTKQFGRKEWMTDRKTMIAPGLVVEANDLQISVAGNGAHATFVQHYKSPRFEDVGPKQLVVVSTADGPRIAREEMLSSSITAQAVAGEAAPIHGAESRGVFIMAGIPETAATTDPVETKHEVIDASQAEAEIDPSVLTADQKAFMGRTFTVYDVTGKPCSARVKSFAIKAVTILHFGMDQDFADTAQYPERAVAAKARARALFEWAEDSSRYLYGRFESPCPGGVFAVQGSSSKVLAPAKGTLTGVDAKKAIRALPMHKRLQAHFTETVPEQKQLQWDDFDPVGTVAVSFQPEHGAPIAVFGTANGPACNSFNGALTAVFDMTDPAKPVARGTVDDEFDVAHVIAALDVDGDGELEFVTGPDGFTNVMSLLRRNRQGVYVRNTFFKNSYFDCPC
jgi:ketosteroid isomerase-like protein